MTARKQTLAGTKLDDRHASSRPNWNASGKRRDAAVRRGLVAGVG